MLVLLLVVVVVVKPSEDFLASELLEGRRVGGGGGPPPVDEVVLLGDEKSLRDPFCSDWGLPESLSPASDPLLLLSSSSFLVSLSRRSNTFRMSLYPKSIGIDRYTM